MNSYRGLFEKKAKTLVRLHDRIHETFAQRSKSDSCMQEWSDAAKEFHEKYDDLAFYEGDSDYRKLIRSGDKKAIDYYIAFLEVRPYFFRSGYIYKDLIRVLKNCNLSPVQRSRYDTVKKNYFNFRKSQRENR